MYLDCTVDILEAPGRISTISKGNATYVRYVSERIYKPDKKYTSPNHKVIGKLAGDGSNRMIPNENYLKYFGALELPETKSTNRRSSCLRIGSFLVIRKIMEEYKLSEILSKYLGSKNCGLLLDLAAYSIVAENNAGQYYPDYAYNHPLFTTGMKMYSDSKVSDFLAKIEDDQRVGFLNEWNHDRDHRETIYISYDSTNKNCQAGDIQLVEYGHPKDDKGLPVFNYSIAYDTYNQEPLFYEQYPGSIVDISQLQFMLEKAQGYGYRHVGFILDRGYFSKENIGYMDKCGYGFVIMVKGMNTLVRNLILENRGKFEEDRDCNIRDYKVFGTMVKRQLYASDKEERYFHLYYSERKASAEREQFEARLERMAKCLEQWKGQVRTIADGFCEFYDLEVYEKDGTFLFAREKKEAIIEGKRLCGYLVIVTSERMSAKEALELYKSRDASEKLFLGDKSYLGNKSLRVSSDEAAAGKIFTEFLALIVRSKIYTSLKAEMKKLDKKPNFMTVPAALRELEKIEMIRMTDGKYRMDHAVTATQKSILTAFGMEAGYVKKMSDELSEMLYKYERNRED